MFAAQGCHPDAVVFNLLMEVMWQSGVLTAQMRAMQLWGVANRCGYLRVYSQMKDDSNVAQYSCVTCTAGATVVTILRWLVEVRCGAEGLGISHHKF